MKKRIERNNQKEVRLRVHVAPLERRIQFTGYSSFVVTLPKKWVTSRGLEASSKVYIEEMQDGSLRIYPKETQMDSRGSAQIEITAFTPELIETLERYILGAFLSNYKTITIYSDSEIPFEVQDHLDKIVAKLVGTEIVSQTNNKIILQDMLSLGGVSILQLLKNCKVLASTMHDLATRALQESANSTKASEVYQKERILDRQYYLALRNLYAATSNVMLAQRIGVTPSDVIDYHLVVKNIERIGDHATQIASLAEKWHDRDLDNKYMKLLFDANRQIRELYEQVLESFITGDYALANEVILEGNKLKHLLEEKIENELFASLNASTGYLLLFLRSTLRILNYSTDIGELVINRYARKTANFILS